MSSRLGFVGTPCQVQGLRKLQVLSEKLELDWAKGVGVVIGLFCMGNWSYPCIRGYLEKQGIELERVKKLAISGYEVVVSLSNRRVELPLTGLRRYVRLACKLCLDFTSELADLSVGSVGSPRGWSTLVVRSPLGEELVSRAEAAGEIEVRELSAEGLKKLEEAARKKVERNTRRILGRMKQGVGVPHYTTRELQSLPDASGKGFEELWEEIVVPGLCDACGACSAACEQIEMRNGLPRLKGRCPSGCDRCYTACTRTALPVELLESSSNLRGTRVPYMGRYSRIVAVRATSDELLIRAQDGGAVTALIKFSLNTRLVDATLLTCRGREWEPLATLARSASEVAACAGSVYAASSPLPLLRTRS